MKLNLKNCSKNLKRSQKLSDLHKTPYKSFDDIKRYQNNVEALRSKIMYQIIISFKQFIKTKLQFIRAARQHHKNIAELEGLSDFMLKDIGVYRGDITQLAKESLKPKIKTNDASLKSEPHLKVIESIQPKRQWSNDKNISFKVGLKRCG